MMIAKEMVLENGSKIFYVTMKQLKVKGRQGRHKVTTRPGKFSFQNSLWIGERNMVVKVKEDTAVI